MLRERCVQVQCPLLLVGRLRGGGRGRDALSDDEVSDRISRDEEEDAGLDPLKVPKMKENWGFDSDDVDEDEKDDQGSEEGGGADDDKELAAIRAKMMAERRALGGVRHYAEEKEEEEESEESEAEKTRKKLMEARIAKEEREREEGPQSSVIVRLPHPVLLLLPQRHIDVDGCART